jgi:uncharacterized membrane protein
MSCAMAAPEFWAQFLVYGVAHGHANIVLKTDKTSLHVT